MKINRAPNRLEKLIQAEIKGECRRRKSSLWGQECWIEPAFVDTGRGDRKQLVYVQPMDTRPDYYVLRLDSKEDVEAEDYNWDQLLLRPIEGVYGSESDYKWDWDERGRWIGRDYFDEDMKPIEYNWPMLSWSGGSWGVIKNFGNPLK